ncbi:hypothetical protein GCM10010406_37420 [Streptomyces thermolineatus]|uniref:Uncharacterized protein n=1 Tax=Streptomyces thermolineatus TaxID=44033 RepID=A0ABN3M7Y8_9ACTN
MPEQLIWTVLPDGQAGNEDDRRLRLSVLVSPRLTTPDGGEGSLSAFPALRHWTATAAATRFALEVDGAVVADGLQPLNTFAPHLWESLFTDRTPVHPHTFDDYSGHRLVSYPLRTLRDRIRRLYANVALAGADLPPTVDERTESRRGFLPRELDRQGFGFVRPSPSPAPTPTPSPGEGDGDGPVVKLTAGDVTGPGGGEEALEPEEEDVAAFRRFHDRPKRPGAPLPREDELPDLLDFHRAVSCLGDYPALMRRLGLVLDLEAPAGAVPDDGAAHLLRVLPRRAPAAAPGPAGPSADVSPATRSVRSGDDFAAASGPDVQQGLLHLDEGRFDLVGTDVDGAVHKVVNLALNLRAAHGRAAADQPAAAGLPVLHSAGLSLARLDRAAALASRLKGAKDLNDVLQGADPAAAVLDAEHLVRGHRIDVWDSRSRTWHSLCRRNGTYRFENTGAEEHIEDEGFVQLSAAGVPPEQGQPSATPELYLHESLVRWDGWSLVAPRPGLPLPDDQDPAAAPRRPDNAAVTSFGLRTGFTPVSSSLPALRYGVGYRMRVRVVDLAGNSRPFEDPDDGHALPAEADGHRYLRHEAVPSPVVALRGPLTPEDAPGESLERIVIRSANTGRAGDDTPTTATAERHIAPPRTTPAQAEAHGAFDDGTGRLRGDAATYRMIRDHDAAEPAGGSEVPVVPADRMELRHLPDVLARGAALRDLPGTPDGTVGTIDSAGRLAHLPEEVALPGSATLVGFGPTSAWPAAQPFRLLLQEGDGPPQWDAENRVLTVSLPKGETAEVPLSCFFHRADLKLLALWDWTRREIDLRSAATTNPEELEALTKDVLELTQRTLEGGHWAFTPARTLTLVHAVQQPLGAPLVDRLRAERSFGATDARLLGALRVHPSSTAGITLAARWDETAGSGPDPFLTHPVEDCAAEFPLPHDGSDGAVLSRGRFVAGYDSWTGEIVMDEDRHPLHEFGDTRHRTVRYRAVAASRFAECFRRRAEVALRGTGAVVLDPGGLAPNAETVRSTDGSTTFTRAGDGTDSAGGDYRTDPATGAIARCADGAVADGQTVRVDFLPPVSRTGEEVTVEVPSSARPAAPRVLYVVPLFEWHRHTSTNLLASHRHGNWLRVYLEGPWFSSGEGEKLGVVVARGPGEPQEPLARYVTRTALDPLRSGGSLPSDFPEGERDSGPAGAGLTLEELDPAPGNRVDVFAHEVAHDPERDLWYCDIEVAPPPGALRPPAFEPFVRLALARHQPHSVVEFDPAHPEKLRDVTLSRVVTADFAQTHADRSVLLTHDPWRPSRLRLVVSGDGYERVAEGTGPSRIEVSVQRRAPGLRGDLAWTPAPDASVEPRPPAAATPAAVLWQGDVVLPEGRDASGFRVVVEERDTLPADDPGRPGRLLYADVLDIGELGTPVLPKAPGDGGDDGEEKPSPDTEEHHEWEHHEWEHRERERHEWERPRWRDSDRRRRDDRSGDRSDSGRPGGRGGDRRRRGGRGGGWR